MRGCLGCGVSSQLPAQPSPPAPKSCIEEQTQSQPKRLLFPPLAWGAQLPKYLPRKLPEDIWYNWLNGFDYLLWALISRDFIQIYLIIFPTQNNHLH